jgi:hypothetical protein
MFEHADRSKNEQFETSQDPSCVGSHFPSPLPNGHRARNRSKRKSRCPIPRDQGTLIFGYSSAIVPRVNRIFAFGAL